MKAFLAFTACALVLGLSANGASAGTTATGNGERLVVTTGEGGSGVAAVGPGHDPASPVSGAPAPPLGAAASFINAVGTCLNGPVPVVAPVLGTLHCPARTPPPPSAADLARQWSQGAALPAPRLVVQPGHAVTGLPAYLEIHTPDRWTIAIPDPIRNDIISISCGHTGFDVDWGDHTAVDHTSSVGGPYPGGDVTHAYQGASPRDTLTVTEHWSCTWSDPLGDGGTIAGLQSTGQLPLEIREIQTTNG